MTISTQLLTTTCDIYRPFGAGSPTTTGVACQLVPCLDSGRGSTSAANYLIWSHYINVADSVDIRDGCTRTAAADQITYADGDEVRIPDASGTRYVVVWVELCNRGSTMPFKRAYLLRDQAIWPGP